MADILYLVERLENVLAQGWRLPFSSNAVINEDAFIDVVEQMHIAIPVEIRQAQQIVQQKERILAQAREEAERMLEHAYQQAERLVMQAEVVTRSQERAAEIRQQAKEEAELVRAGADDYALDVLTRLQDELQVYLRQVDNGVERLTAVQQASASPPTSAPLTFDDEDVADFLEEMDEFEQDEEPRSQ